MVFWAAFAAAFLAFFGFFLVAGRSGAALAGFFGLLSDWFGSVTATVVSVSGVTLDMGWFSPFAAVLAVVTFITPFAETCKQNLHRLRSLRLNLRAGAALRSHVRAVYVPPRRESNCSKRSRCRSQSHSPARRRKLFSETTSRPGACGGNHSSRS